MTYELTPSDRDALSDYGTLPNPIKGFTTQELIDELCDRDGVESTEVLRPEKYWITQTDEDEAYDPLRGVGPATILVVRKA